MIFLANTLPHSPMWECVKSCFCPVPQSCICVPFNYKYALSVYTFKTVHLFLTEVSLQCVLLQSAYRSIQRLGACVYSRDYITTTEVCHKDYQSSTAAKLLLPAALIHGRLGDSMVCSSFRGVCPCEKCVDSDGTCKQNRGEAMWALHSHGSQDQWIRLIPANEGCCSTAFPDRRWWIRLLSGPMSAQETQWWGEAKGEIRAAQSQDQQHVDKGLSQSVCSYRS